MNRHENTYHRSGRWLIVLLLLWIAVMVWVSVFPPKVETDDSAYTVYAAIFGILFVTMAVLSVVRMVAYIRWTGKYPFYFLFRKPRSGAKPEMTEEIHGGDR